MSLRAAVGAATAVAAVFLAACGRQAPEAARPPEPSPAAPTADVGATGVEAKIVAAVSILPQAFLLQRVGGQRVEALVLVEQGQSPATYEPTARQMAQLARARTYFSIGLPFEEALLERIGEAMPGLEVVDTREGIELRAMETGTHEAHEPGGAEQEGTEEAPVAAEPGEEGEPLAAASPEPVVQGEPTMDPHVWLDPRNAKKIAHTMQRELVRLDPEGSEQYEQNLLALDAELDRLDATISRILKPLAGSELLVYHPAFGYLADAYGLRQVAIETEGKEPGPKELASIVKRARSSGARVVFVQPEFADSAARAIAEEIGGAVVPINPLSGDYIENLAEMASTIKSGLVGVSDRRPEQDE